MRSLLDVNFVIALFDEDHVFHQRAHEWWATEAQRGWASCPLTENGIVRILSNPNYAKNRRWSPLDAVRLLNDFTFRTDHQFWPDDISIREEELLSFDRIHGARAITDHYLLALATKNQGRLVTFDVRILTNAVVNATEKNLCVP